MTEANKAFNESSTQLLPEIREDLKAYLQYMKELGYQGLVLSEDSVKILERWNKGRVAETLDTIQVDLGACQRCKLHKGRKHIVFGAGNPGARLVFVGEGPGHEEDIQGEPFVGKAGQLLTKILRAIGLTREDVYICNIIKCRPPGNRNPEPDGRDRRVHSFSPKTVKSYRTWADMCLGHLCGPNTSGDQNTDISVAG
jgi:DNA polymerase